MRKLSLREISESGKAGRTGESWDPKLLLFSSDLWCPLALGVDTADSPAEVGSSGLLVQQRGWPHFSIHSPGLRVGLLYRLPRGKWPCGAAAGPGPEQAH